MMKKGYALIGLSILYSCSGGGAYVEQGAPYKGRGNDYYYDRYYRYDHDYHHSKHGKYHRHGGGHHKSKKGKDS